MTQVLTITRVPLQSCKRCQFGLADEALEEEAAGGAARNLGDGGKSEER